MSILQPLAFYTELNDKVGCSAQRKDRVCAFYKERFPTMTNKWNMCVFEWTSTNASIGIWMKTDERHIEVLLLFQKINEFWNLCPKENLWRYNHLLLYSISNNCLRKNHLSRRWMEKMNWLNWLPHLSHSCPTKRLIALKDLPNNIVHTENKKNWQYLWSSS